MRFAAGGLAGFRARGTLERGRAAPVEELNLAVSEPLVCCVLTLDDRECDKSGLLENAGCFLRPVCGRGSNLVRLLLEKVYSKRFRAAGIA